ncbi:ATP-binding protein [Nonomuraea recticatena]|uniref:ATP-binding protein n=1 Tax=Nonomuraea recticatena TaxID=46178 RepID=UPI0036136A70
MRPSRGLPGNLPAPMGELIGRAEAIGEVTALLDVGRLVTLTGPGGVGKTSLALEAARRLAPSFPDGAWLVELGALPSHLGDSECSAEEVTEAVAAVLGIRDESGALSLAETMRGKRALLVLDNCEHVLAPVAELAGALLRAVPELRIMATSRRPLGVAGERLWQVPPLASPSALRLFEARATARAPGFTVDAGNEATVAAICARLDGIPLALELAATRVRALGVNELAVRLGALHQDAPHPPEDGSSQGTLDGFRVLAAGASDAPARQRTLRAVIDWSWELLGDDERAVLRRLAVHAGGCTLRAAEAVCGDEGLDVMDLMAGLVDHSLVTVSTGASRATSCSSRSPPTAVSAWRRPASWRRSSGGTFATTPSWPSRPSRACGGPSSASGWPGWTPRAPTCAPPSAWRSGTAARCAWSTRWPGTGCCADASARAAERSSPPSRQAATRTTRARPRPGWPPSPCAWARCSTTPSPPPGPPTSKGSRAGPGRNGSSRWSGSASATRRPARSRPNASWSCFAPWATSGAPPPR